MGSLFRVGDDPLCFRLDDARRIPDRADADLRTRREWRRDVSDAASTSAAQTLARQTPYRTEPVRFQSPSANLGGWLLVPNTPGPLPPSSCIHGMVRPTRQSLLPLPTSSPATALPSWCTTSADRVSPPAARPRDLRRPRARRPGWRRPAEAASRHRRRPHRVAGCEPRRLGGAARRVDVDRRHVRDRRRRPLPLRPPSTSASVSNARCVQTVSIATTSPRRGPTWRRKLEWREPAKAGTPLSGCGARAEREGWAQYMNTPSSLDILRWNWEHVLSSDPRPGARAPHRSRAGALRRTQHDRVTRGAPAAAVGSAHAPSQPRLT